MGGKIIKEVNLQLLVFLNWFLYLYHDLLYSFFYYIELINNLLFYKQNTFSLLITLININYYIHNVYYIHFDYIDLYSGYRILLIY